MLRTNKKNGFRNSLLTCGAMALVMGGIASAQSSSRTNSQTGAPLTMQTDYLGYGLGVSLRALYSDNINLQSGANSEDEIVLSNNYSGAAIVSTPLVTAIVLGDLDLSYLTEQSEFVANQNIGATSTFTAVKDWLYLDVSGSSSRQIVGDNARFSRNQNAARGQRVNVHTYSASPYLYHQYGNQSTTELRYRFSEVRVGDRNNTNSALAALTRNDSTAHEVAANYQSGLLLDRVRFGLSAYGNDTTQQRIAGLPDFGYRQGSVSGSVLVPVTPRFALSGIVGYDDLETKDGSALFFNASDLSGVYWRAGFTAQPGPRSSIRLEYGKRYGDDFIDANISYDISSRLTFRANANRSFRTRGQSVTSQFQSNQLATLQFADQLRQGATASPREIIRRANFFAGGQRGVFAQTTGVAVSNNVQAYLVGDYGRTTVTMNGFYRDDDFGFRQTESIGGNLQLRRALSRKLNGYGSFRVRNAETTVDVATCLADPTIFGFDPTDPLFNAATDCAAASINNGQSTTLTSRIGASYNVFQNASAFMEVARTDRFSQNNLFEYVENTVMIGVTLDLQ